MFWHSFECSNPKCSRDETGLIMDIRTGTKDQPKGVKCPHCQRYPRYRSFWAADEAGFGSTGDGRVPHEALVRVLRKLPKTELLQALRDVKIGDEWVGHKDSKMFVLFQLGLPFHEIGVVKEVQGSWEGYAEGQNVIRCDDPDTARHAVQDHLVRELNYIFPL